MSSGISAQEKSTQKWPVTAAGERAYLYAIIAKAEEQRYGECGIDGGEVYSVSAGRVAAVISRVGVEKLRPERARLAAHQEVLKKLLAVTTPLPMAFVILADNVQAVRRMLQHNQQALLEQLGHVAGRVEMGLRITWDVPNIFEYFVNTHPELRVARDRLLGGLREPTQEDKIEVGRLFDRLLNEDRRVLFEQVEEIFSRQATEVKPLNCRSEREVMNLACLIQRKARAQFEAEVFEVAKLFDNNFALNYSGPWAPHNFVETEIEF